MIIIGNIISHLFTPVKRITKECARIYPARQILSSALILTRNFLDKQSGKDSKRPAYQSLMKRNRTCDNNKSAWLENYTFPSKRLLLISKIFLQSRFFANGFIYSIFYNIYHSDSSP
jgi:hypothetical protein